MAIAKGRLEYVEKLKSLQARSEAFVMKTFGRLKSLSNKTEIRGSVSCLFDMTLRITFTFEKLRPLKPFVYRKVIVMNRCLASSESAQTVYRNYSL